MCKLPGKFAFLSNYSAAIHEVVFVSSTPQIRIIIILTATELDKCVFGNKKSYQDIAIYYFTADTPAGSG